MVPILFGNHSSFCHFFALVVVRGPHFCVKLKMCTNRLHIIGQMGFKQESHEAYGTADKVL